LPEDDFDYKAFVEQEFGPKRRLARGIHWFWWCVAVAVLILLATIWLR
jgi:hypothetical protein